MEDVLKKLQGKKTYIVLIIAAVVWLTEALGWLTPDLAANAYQILIVLGGATAAAKINRLVNGNNS